MLRSIASVAWVLPIGLALSCDEGEPACPPGHRPDAGRAARLRALVAEDPEGAQRGLVGSQYLMCFSRGGANVLSGRTMLLDQSLDDEHLAARVLHLFAHAATGSTLTSGDPGKPDEAEATALERRFLERAAQRARRMPGWDGGSDGGF